MANIEAEIQKIAHQFVQEIVRALVGSSIQEFAQLAGKSPARAPRAAAAPAAPKGKRGPKAAAKAAKAEKAPANRARKADKKRNRRSSDEIVELTKQVIDHIRDTASDHADGISVSEIAKALKVDIEDITRPIHRAVEEGKLRKKGEKRLTRYFPGKGE